MPEHTQKRLLSLLAILAMLFLMADTCVHSVNKKQATVTVFEDTDGDGQMDRGEAVIPNTLVLGEFNIHGSFRRTGAVTDEEGKASLEVEYTHIFKVIVVPPCQATATTPTSLDATQEKRLRFGFAPQKTSPSPALVHFKVWEDRDGNGEQDAGEPALSSFPLSADPLPETAPQGGIYFGSLVAQTDEQGSATFNLAQTDEQGSATFNLGNSCGKIMTPVQYGWNYTSSSPEPSRSDGGLWFVYGEGVMEVSLGVYPIPTPTPFPTWTPESSE